MQCDRRRWRSAHPLPWSVWTLVSFASSRELPRVSRPEWLVRLLIPGTLPTLGLGLHSDLHRVARARAEQECRTELWLASGAPHNFLCAAPLLIRSAPRVPIHAGDSSL